MHFEARFRIVEGVEPTDAREGDIVRRIAKSRSAKETLAFIDGLPALLERREIPSPASRANGPEPPARRIEGKAMPDRKCGDLVVGAE